MFKLAYLTDHPELMRPVAELGHLEFGYLNPGRSLEDRLEKLHSHLNQDQLPICFVGFQNNKFVGTTALRSIDIDSYTEVTPWLGSVIVIPELRGQGIGTLLVQETMKRAFDLGNEKWFLYTPNRESFYAKMGWKTIGTHVHNQVPGVIMQLSK